MRDDKQILLPVIPLRNVVVLPKEVVHCDAARKKTLAAMQAATATEGLAFFCAQRDAAKNDLTFEDFYQVGTVCKIRQIFKINGDGLHLLITGIARARIEEYVDEEPYFKVKISYLDEKETEFAVAEALRRKIIDGFEEFAKITNRFTSDQKNGILKIEAFGDFVDVVAQGTINRVEDKQQLLEECSQRNRAMLLIRMLSEEIEVLRVEKQIAKQVSAQIEKNQREYYLREQLKVVQKELGDDMEDESREFLERMRNKNLPEEVAKRLEKEIRRFKTMPMGSHEAPMTRNYIECLLDLPWTEQSEDCLDLNHAREILDEDHYGMEKVKDRMIEFLAVKRLTGKSNGAILCLVGPPGVGKTSIASSVARAMGRQFVRMSLGGVKDEAEIRGHRRTYIGALPGRVISAMRQSGTINPLILFDEIDKLGNDMRGDPASAMLEVLDQAQNFAFRDHFLEIPYDLSNAVLLTTANDADAIPKPLLDRMEVIEVPSYLSEEKLQIAKHHLLPKQLEAHGLKKSNLRISDEQIMYIIEGYTREAGVRELERVLASVCRKVACEIGEGKDRVCMSMQKMQKYLGHEKYRKESIIKEDTVGVVRGLAWTAVGGKTLAVEAVVVPGNGTIQLTGHLGEVMQESGRAAMTYIRANARQMALPENFYKKQDVHVHVPEGAVPKDGPSAGITMATAIVSALMGIPVKRDVAMTGEITLSGRVLPIGGLREKLLAAVRADVKTVILPAANRPDLKEVPQSVQDKLKIVFAEQFDEVLNNALVIDSANNFFQITGLTMGLLSKQMGLPS